MTAQEYFNQFLVEKNKISQLDELNSESSVAVYRLLYQSIAQVLQYHDDITQDAIDNMNIIKQQTIVGTQQWWYDKLINFFQYNTDPQIGLLKIGNDYDYYYDITDNNSKIIKYCSFKQQANSLTIKLAKQVDDLPAVLTANELSSVYAFINQIQIAGVSITPVSFPADWLSYNVDVYISGTYVKADKEQEVKDAVNNYLNNIAFAGVLYLIDLENVIRQIDGVVNVVTISATGFDNGKTVGTDLTIDTQFKYETISGYIKLDTAFSNINIIQI